jgi:hypothetical protein
MNEPSPDRRASRRPTGVRSPVPADRPTPEARVGEETVTLAGWSRSAVPR